MQQALTGYEKALNSFSMLKDSPKQAGVLNSIGFIYDLLGETSKALNYYDQSLKLWHLVGDRQREAITLTNIGIAHAKLGSGDKALEQSNVRLVTGAGKHSHSKSSGTFTPLNPNFKRHRPATNRRFSSEKRLAIVGARQMS
jgi:tetratricopeptide (TPR) repeat protein